MKDPAFSPSHSAGTTSENTEDLFDYQGTPSYYNSRQVFERFLAKTAYYKALQDAVSRIAGVLQPQEMLELGSGTGATACRLAAEHPGSRIHGIDARENMVEAGRGLAKDRKLNNLTFSCADLLEYVTEHQNLPEWVYMLYVFHHIPDPVQKKINFLKTCHDAMLPGSYLCIADVFIPELPNAVQQRSELSRIWSARSMEAYTGVFWHALQGLTPEAVAKASEAGRYSMQKEQEAGELVMARDQEYMISTSWLVRQAARNGFEVIINEPVNTVADSVVLLRKPETEL